MNQAVVFIGHGSRRANSNNNFEKLVDAYKCRHPEQKVFHGYIELAKPFMGTAIREAAKVANVVTVMPLLLFRAGHAKNDIPMELAEIRKEYPNIDFKIADVIGPHPFMSELAWERACESNMLPQNPEETSVVFIGRGSSDPDANSDFYKLTRMFTEGRNLSLVLPCFIGITDPKLEETLDLAARTRPKNLLVVPYFLLTGVLIERINEKVAEFSKNYPWVKTAVAEPLGLHDNLFKTIEYRLEQAESGSPMACDGCRYRTPLPQQEEHVGGLKALLWSRRHSFTHNQAMPQEHTHKPMKKHVLICGNVDCVDKGSVKLLANLRKELKDRGLQKEIAVTRTSCMGRCGEGPTVAVYPDGIWYKEVQAEDAVDLTEKHLMNDQLVSRLVDDILT